MKKIVSLLAGVFVAAPLMAADLMQVYREAQERDPAFAVAKANLEAGQEKVPQGRAGLLPTLNLTGNTIWNDNQINRPGAAVLNQKYNGNTYTLALSQPLFRWANWVGYEQSKFQLAQAEATFVQAKQDLILRVAQAYFDIALARENLRAAQANKVAIEQQLESAQKNFEVGTATITDTHEAQSRYDLATAQEIVAQSDLDAKQRALQAIIGKEAPSIALVKRDLTLSQPQPADMNQWVAAAEKNNVAVQVQQALAEIASAEVEKQRAGHYPTVDIVANLGNVRGPYLGAVAETEVANVGLQFSLPIFAGGSVLSRQREAIAARAAAQANVEGAKRAAALQARQFYLGVVNGLAQIRALRAALTSSQLALESNKLGYEVGVRINIDVLNAENQLYTTRRDAAKAVIDTLMAQLRLKAAVAALGDDDVAQINALLDPSSVQ